MSDDDDDDDDHHHHHHYYYSPSSRNVSGNLRKEQQAFLQLSRTNSSQIQFPGFRQRNKLCFSKV